MNERPPVVSSIPGRNRASPGETLVMRADDRIGSLSEAGVLQGQGWCKREKEDGSKMGLKPGPGACDEGITGAVK